PRLPENPPQWAVPRLRYPTVSRASRWCCGGRSGWPGRPAPVCIASYARMIRGPSERTTALQFWFDTIDFGRFSRVRDATARESFATGVRVDAPTVAPFA